MINRPRQAFFFVRRLGLAFKAFWRIRCSILCMPHKSPSAITSRQTRPPPQVRSLLRTLSARGWSVPRHIGGAGFGPRKPSVKPRP
jgi:hypothetical protein